MINNVRFHINSYLELMTPPVVKVQIFDQIVGQVMWPGFWGSDNTMYSSTGTVFLR